MTEAIVHTRDQIELIKRTVANGTTDDELKLFLYTAARTGLDPLARQIYAIKRWNAAEERDVMAIQTGIDGYRVVASRTGDYAGSDDAVFGPEIENSKFPSTATVTVWKFVHGQRVAFTATARWSEYYPGDKKGFQWRRMPHTMLAKCAEALALRKGFPSDLSGVYTFEEMDQASGRSEDISLDQRINLAADEASKLVGITPNGLKPGEIIARASTYFAGKSELTTEERWLGAVYAKVGAKSFTDPTALDATPHSDRWKRWTLDNIRTHFNLDKQQEGTVTVRPGSLLVEAVSVEDIISSENVTGEDAVVRNGKEKKNG